MINKINSDIAIIGAGASGMVAAISAGQISMSRIILLEKLPRIGKKILSTGNGRCNLSNTAIDVGHYSGDVRLLQSANQSFTDSASFFEQLGVAVKSDNDGRIYPHSMTASSVLDALRFAISDCGIEVMCDCNVTAVKKSDGGFLITANDGNDIIFAKRVIISTGGLAAPSMGSNGDGYRLAKAVGHSVTKLYPALAPLRTPIEAVKALKGLRAYAKASLIHNKEIIATEIGEVQFSDGALSGICIFNLSAVAAMYIGNCEISLDIAPDYSIERLREIIIAIKEKRAGLPLEELLTGLFHKRIGISLIKSIGYSPATECSGIGYKEIDKLCRLIKDWRFKITAVSDYSLAQITCGGINSDEVGDDFQSLICRGLYFCGEILDVQGKCGGYNLDFAWKSGYAAGKNAAISLM